MVSVPKAGGRKPQLLWFSVFLAPALHPSCDLGTYFSMIGLLPPKIKYQNSCVFNTSMPVAPNRIQSKPSSFPLTPLPNSDPIRQDTPQGKLIFSVLEGEIAMFICSVFLRIHPNCYHINPFSFSHLASTVIYHSIMIHREKEAKLS